MAAIVDVVLPVFAIMLAGYLAGRFRLLGDASSEALNGFVYYGAIPALFFVSMAQAPLGCVEPGRKPGAGPGAEVLPLDLGDVREHACDQPARGGAEV